MPVNERDLFDSILSESRWYLKTIALQLVAETFAVALFKMMSESAPRSGARDGLQAHPAGRVPAHGIRHARAPAGRE